LPDTSATSLLPDLDFETFDLANIDFAYIDEAGAMRTPFKVQKLVARLNKLDLNNETVDIGEIDLDASESPIFFGQLARPADASADTAATAPSDWRVKGGGRQLANP